MNRSTSLFALLPVALWLTGCSGSSAPTSSPAPTEQTFGSLTTRIVGAAQSPVTSSSANGANVTGIAGALVDRLTLNAQGAPTLAETRIAFTSDRDGNTQIYTMNADGTGVTRLTNNGAFDSSPNWSFDNSKIAFESNRDGNYEVYAMNADGTGQTRLTNNPASDSNGCYSPDGSKIAFTSNRDGNSEIYLMNANGTGQTRLTNDAATDEVPVFSPDGSKIAFYSSRDGNFEIYTMNADGTNPTRLTNNAANDFGPSWSPDGSKIVFNSSRDGNFEIYTMNADGTSPTRLTNSSTFEAAPVFSPDGSQIAFITGRDGNNEIYSMSASGGAAVNLTKKPSVYDATTSKSWSGYFPRTPRTLVGAGGALGATAAGFLYAQNGAPVSSVVAFDTSTAGSRAASRVVSQSAPFNDQGRNLIFSITTNAGLASVSYANVSAAGVPGTAVSPTIPAGSTGAIVSFVASDGTVNSVLPYAANRSVGLKPTRAGDTVTYAGSFTAIFDGSGKNLAPGGAKSVTLDEKTGKLVRFE